MGIAVAWQLRFYRFYRKDLKGGREVRKGNERLALA
jgi:hypothetical protein